jgi:hypothetical protein
MTIEFPRLDGLDQIGRLLSLGAIDENDPEER